MSEIRSAVKSKLPTPAQTRTTDVLVIGAGPAGLAAATAAAQHGRRVLVLDDSPAAGGQIWRTGVEAPAGKHDIARTRAIEAFQNSGAELLSSRRIFDASPNRTVRALLETARTPTAETFSAPYLILATGARERFLPFPGWTLPGVFGAGGLQALVKGGYNVEGKRVVIAGTGPLLLAVAEHLQQYGATIVSINEQASFARLARLTASLWRQPRKLAQGLRLRAALHRVPYRTGTWPTAVAGSTSVSSVTLTDGRRTWQEPCDLLACGFHLVANTELPALLGCHLSPAGLVTVDDGQRTSVPDIFCVGEPTGIAGIDAAMLQGRIAGLHAAGQPELARKLTRLRNRERRFGQRLDRTFELRPELRTLAKPDTVVCRCEDVCYAALAPHPTWTDAKLQTRCGMGACQGRVCGPAVHTLFGWRATSVRPPIFPVPIAVFSTDPTFLSTESATLQETPQ